MQQTIVLAPNKILTTPAKVVHPEEDLEKILYSMTKVLDKERGIGIAAPQIGVDKQIIMISAPGLSRKNRRYVIFLNPIITDMSDFFDMQEGCLSLPGEIYQVKRAMNITLEADVYTGRGGRWEHIKEEFVDQFAQVIQHEVDHLKGVLINNANTTK